MIPLLILASWVTGVHFTVPAEMQVCPCLIPDCNNVVIFETNMVRVVRHVFAPGGLYSKPVNTADTLYVEQGTTGVDMPGFWIGSPPGWGVALSWWVVDAAGNVSCSVDRSTKTLLNMAPGVLK